MNYCTDQADQTDQTQPYFCVPTVPPPPLPPLPPSECPPISSPNLITLTTFIDPSFSLANNPNNSEISITDDDNNRSKLQLDESDMLQQLLKDPLLSDLAKLNSEGNISLEEVDTLIALETGTAFEIKIERDGLEPFFLVVRQNSTIADLKKLIRLNFERQQRKQNVGLGRIKKSSWKYIWKTYCLMFENKRLLQDKMPLQEYGIRSGNVLKFSRFIGKQRKEVNKK
ncbi:4140_t:CDS:2 [Diversispora eburnea]|uniref:4140_t:CDS:1 n=1 Tax=Diversispora eburnea TaxID=1213867 RepID=A0A9N8YM26_9GLOM|nr:4140_t:CDS:2 [Diversispora eburnea]